MKVIAENLSTEEIQGLKQMFNNMDTDGSGTITYEELKSGLSRLGSKLSESEIKQLMDAVSTLNTISFSNAVILLLLFFFLWAHKEIFSFSPVRLMLIRVGLSITSNSLQQPCIATGLRRKRTCTRLSNTSTKMEAGKC